MTRLASVWRLPSQLQSLCMTMVVSQCPQVLHMTCGTRSRDEELAAKPKSWVWTDRTAGVSLIGTKTVSKGRPRENGDESEHWDEGASLRKDCTFRSASRNNFKEARSCPALVLLCEHPILLTLEKPIPVGQLWRLVKRISPHSPCLSLLQKITAVYCFYKYLWVWTLGWQSTLIV